jgi:XTP/dITP diphosphohydrolase
MKIYFVTANDQKFSEAQGCIDMLQAELSVNVNLCQIKVHLQEILTRDIDAVVKNKAVAAYRYLGIPCVVEHSGLFMDALPDLPGVLGRMIWEAVGDRICGFLREGDSRAAVARSVIGYCDGRRILLHSGRTPGRVAEAARGEYTLNWDPIFIPEGSEQTYGEMGRDEKRATSPSVKAWRDFLQAQVSKNQHLFSEP